MLTLLRSPRRPLCLSAPLGVKGKKWHEIYLRSAGLRLPDGLVSVDAKRHPGKVTLATRDFPVPLNRALLTTLADSALPIPSLLHEAHKLRLLLDKRRPSYDATDADHRKAEARRSFTKELLDKWGNDYEEEEMKLKLAEREAAIAKRESSALYKVRRLDFSRKERSLHYLLARMPEEMATLAQIFHEIRVRNPEWTPTSVLDFGSGVGSGYWAARETWPNLRTETKDWTNVDISPAMLDLHRQLVQAWTSLETAETAVKTVRVINFVSICKLTHYFVTEACKEGDAVLAALAAILVKQGGSLDSEAESAQPGMSWRQYLPSSENPSDLVIVSHTLMEISSLAQRRELVQELWSRAGRFLVLAETGSRAGFELLADLREILLAAGDTPALNSTKTLVLDAGLDPGPLEDIRTGPRGLPMLQSLRAAYPQLSIPTLAPKGHVFAPCPHDLRCPRLALDPKEPCNFQVRLKTPSLTSGGAEEVRSYRFAFLVLEKGERRGAAWPRVVRAPIIHKRHAVLRMCTNKGCLEEAVVTKKTDGTPLHRLCKQLSWGDSAPLQTDLKPPQAAAAEEQVNDTPTQATA